MAGNGYDYVELPKIATSCPALANAMMAVATQGPGGSDVFLD